MAFKTFETEDDYTSAINEALEEKNKGWISERLETARANAIKEVNEKYADYDDLKKQVEAYGTERADFDKRVAEFEQTKGDLEKRAAASEAASLKLKAAAKHGIPLDMAERLQGETAEDIEADAKKIAPNFVHKAAPLRQPEAEAVDGVTAAFRKLNPNIKF